MLPSSSDPEASATVAPVQVLSWQPGAGLQGKADTIVREEPLEIRVRGRSVVVTMRTPGHDRDLAAGFFFTEGIVRQRTDVIEIAPCLQGNRANNVVNVLLADSLEVDFASLTRHVFASSSCGLCGKASIDEIHKRFPPVAGKTKVWSSVLAGLPHKMRARQETFDSTGGLHAAAIFDFKGNLLVAREDIGRHNAVDKVIGWSFLQNRFPLDAHVLLVSGRASFEIVQKALAARIPVVCAISAPSSLAVEFARESGQSLVGFLRGKTLNVYSRPERVAPR